MVDIGIEKAEMSLHRLAKKTKSKFFTRLIRSRRSVRGFFRTFLLIIVIALCMLLAIVRFITTNNNPLSITRNFIYIEPITSYFRKHHNFLYKIDYHDYDYIDIEKTRYDLPGENGQPVYAEKEEEELNTKLFNQNGYYGMISDKIALNRSLPDVRPDECPRKFLADLPTTSIIIPFYNDHLSTLLRTVYSVVNRSPRHLLKEVILVNDHSTKDFLYQELADYIEKHFKGLVKLLVLPKRSGLIWARLAGARAASGDVLLFLDSHVEANTNFLPPLLEPIAKDYRTCVCPKIDVINFKTFQYTSSGTGARGVFDWRLSYKSIPLRPKDQINKWDNYENPVMAGGLFAISTKFFWELGGYDTGLDIWGGEQYELSFKIWLCHGQMLDVPCSRIAHVYRGSMPFPNDRVGIDFIAINYKRVAEVWMDEYKEHLYKRDLIRYNRTDAGDLSYQFYIKKRQNCKSFKYFMEVVAPDMLDRFPYVEPPVFASGAIQSVAEPKYCLDAMNRPVGAAVGLYPCSTNKIKPQRNQNFVLRYYRDIALSELCLDAYGPGERRELKMEKCHYGQGNQYFRYDLDSMQIRHAPYHWNNCVEIDAKTRTAFQTKCNSTRETQKFKWGFTNETNIRNWLNYGSRIVDQEEIKNLKKLWQK